MESFGPSPQLSPAKNHCCGVRRGALVVRSAAVVRSGLVARVSGEVFYQS